MSDTTNNINALSPSTRVPTWTVTPSSWNQVTLRTTGSVTCTSSSPLVAPDEASAPGVADASVLTLPDFSAELTRWIQPTPTTTDSTKMMASAAMPISEPPRGSRLPNPRIAKNDTAGMRGMIQAWVSMGADL